jgi:hypothetical protein
MNKKNQTIKRKNEKLRRMEFKQNTLLKGKGKTKLASSDNGPFNLA